MLMPRRRRLGKAAKSTRHGNIEVDPNVRVSGPRRPSFIFCFAFAFCVLNDFDVNFVMFLKLIRLHFVFVLKYCIDVMKRTYLDLNAFMDWLPVAAYEFTIG